MNTDDFTNICVACENEFTTGNTCCCDNGVGLDGDGEVHRDGVCVRCCEPNHSRFIPYDGMRVGGGTFMRGE